VVDADDTLYQKFFACRKPLQHTHIGRFVIREEKKKNFSPSNNLIKKYKKSKKKEKRKLD